jgi:hypothetical protein
MADFSLTTVFVVPTSQITLPAPSTKVELLGPGEFGIYDNNYEATDLPGTARYFYIAQGRSNNYLQGTKRSDKIKGCSEAGPCNSNVTEWYKVTGCPYPTVQITDVDGWNVKCGDIVTLTLRAHSSYIDTLYFNGFTRSVTVQAPCCDCGGDPCDTVDVPALIDAFIIELNKQAPGNNPDNISFSTFYNFFRVGSDASAKLRIAGKPLTKYGVPCDIAAFPWEYDRMYFRTFVYSGPATTADFIVADNCNIVADANIIQRANYPKGTTDEIAQLEKNFYSYQAGYLKHLYRMAGYNQNFESFAEPNTVYDTFYIKFNEYDRSAYSWGDYIKEDSMVIIAIENGNALATEVEDALVNALGTVLDLNPACSTTTSSTTEFPTPTTQYPTGNNP